MKIIKRNGSEAEFDKAKIGAAITKANNAIPETARISPYLIKAIEEEIAGEVAGIHYTVSVEEVQDMVERKLMDYHAVVLATAYIKYREKRAMARQANSTDDQILSLIDSENELVKQENSNKKPTVVSVQRDYMAGEVSKDLSRRILLPQEIVEAHDRGIIHFHDMDYYSQRMHNCCLVNLEDMLQNGTVISGTLIEKPHSFKTACNIATQAVAQIASSQYGGQTITLAHLAPFVDVSRQAFRKKYEKENEEFHLGLSEDSISRMVEADVRKEIKDGVQTIQYQVITLMTTNGQAPFISVAMYLNEAINEREKEDLALIIEEMLKQRIQGVKNEKGVWITPAFPKLLYFLQEDNIHEGDKYYYLTELAAECTAKRMVPDYISEKMMKELKLSKGETPGNGDAYPCMGCVAGDEVIIYEFFGKVYTESFERMWLRLEDYFEVKTQPNGTDKYMDTPGVLIYDQAKGFVANYRVIRNHSHEWKRIVFTNGRTIMCTPDHPFETENRGVVLAKDLADTDKILLDKGYCNSEKLIHMNPDRAWLYGFALCDSTYYDSFIASIAAVGEDDIAKKFIDVIKDEFGFDVKTVLQERGIKGTYKDLKVVAGDDDKFIRLKFKLANVFEGKAKKDRHIPNEVFAWDKDAKLSFLAGMIDADGYINSTGSLTYVQIGSTNKELAIQQLLLAQSLGMPSAIYLNYYRSNDKNKIRYRVEFVPTQELMDRIICEKKIPNNISIVRKNASIRDENVITLKFCETVIHEGYSYDVTTASEHFTVSGISSHNCRSFLTPDRSGNGFDNAAKALNYKPEPKYYGRLNQGVVTINLPHVALSSGKDMGRFWEIFDERLELCHRALQERHKRLEGTLSDASPIHWQHGALARLEKGEKIDKLLHGGYSTISLGYAGLYECVKYMTGYSHTDEKGNGFALEVMQHMNDKCAAWKEAEDIDYSLYGTPLESSTYKFAKANQKEFGIIPDVTDRNYITNSYHVNVREEIDAFTKLSFEAEFQKLSPGGCISYIEVPDMKDNIPAVVSVIQYIYDNIMYAELNTKSDYCQECGYDGEIQIVEDDGKLVWECPNCGNRNQDKMNVARRTCGYIGTQFWNQGRTQEIKDRVLHL